MLITQYILMLIIAVNTAIGIAIYAANPKRSQNRLLFFFCNTLTLWMALVIGIIYSTSAMVAEALIRVASITATTIPLFLVLLHNAIRSPQLKIIHLIMSCKVCFISSIIIMALCTTDFFLIDVRMPTADSPAGTVAEAQYGLGFPIFAAYFLIMILWAIASSTKTMRESKGIAKIELQYVLLGTGLMLIVSFLLSLLIPLIFKTSQVQQFGPISVIVLNAILAYGIATKRILNIGTVIRQIVSYTLLVSYLIAVYSIFWALSKHVLFRLSPNADFLAQVTAAVAIALSMAPAHGKLQDFADKMISTHTVDIPLLMKNAGTIFQSVTTHDALLQKFSELLKAELGACELSVLSFAHIELSTHDVDVKKAELTQIGDSAVVEILNRTKEPVSHDGLVRARQNSLNRKAIAEMRELNAELVVGFSRKTGKNGMVVFGARHSGRIYDKAEQDALQILCNQFAVALENAELYTEMQDSKIRNEIMLDQLVSGVILANTDRKITLLNHEAQRITGISEEEAIGRHIEILPKPIARLLEEALLNEEGRRNVDARLFEQDETSKSLSIRMGTTFLLGHDDNAMGALLVFTDMTELKSLEEQVRRSDQLSSVGTLAAGMAHEIKNPLVTIKTFTQLLPQRFADKDFREDFSSLVAHEVERIDGIVNELLSFSKPTKPHLVPMHLHQTISQILKLTHEQMAQRNITLNNKCNAKADQINGDAKLLSQAFINLTLNAIEAIGSNGTITIGTTNCTYQFANGDTPRNAVSKDSLRIQISDTGRGIPHKSLQKIFDPFFTSKSEGTGMGLSVAHGIVSEHHGVIDVESELGRGTSFYLYLPLFDEVHA